MDDERRKEVLGEQLFTELQAIREYVEDIPSIKSDVAELKADVADIKGDMSMLKNVVRENSSDIADLKRAA
jgi:hypothetical protein